MVAPIVHDSRQTILDAAEQLIVQHGYAGLSMRELSKQSGLAKSTLYHYFQDKQQIYLSVLERDLVLYEQELAAASRVEGSAVIRLHSITARYFEILGQRGSVALAALRRVGELDDRQLTLFKHYRPKMLAPFIHTIQNGIEEGVFRDLNVELTALSIVGMINSFAAQRLLFRLDDFVVLDSPQQLSEHVFDLLCNGLLNPTIPTADPCDQPDCKDI